MRRDVSLLAPVPNAHHARPRAGVVLPVRGFLDAKARLAPKLDADARAELTRRMAEQVVAAAGGLPLVVVTSAREVRAWATELGLDALDDPGRLDDAAHAGVAWCASRDLARAVVAHADLPWARSLEPLARDGSRPVVALVPCHRDDGTPVLSVPVDTPFRFAYGPSSFRRHAAEARRLGLALRVVRDASLAFDIDVPADLAGLDHRSARVGTA